ncbi:MAG: hypothetical protein EB078_01340 [Proteobacteria bacterium]|nr:hypothetical protein [Pseudomonadota bacterium]NDC23208.1 hypothetical protein [Pseudomonadota bacterium]NDD03523.1 hypothetical protein [Pseudomonadota bacterium]
MLVKAESNIPEVKELFKSVMAEPSKLFEMMEFDMRETAVRTLAEMLRCELTLHLGREKLGWKKWPLDRFKTLPSLTEFTQ